MQTSHFSVAVSFIGTTGDAGAYRRAKHSLLAWPVRHLGWLAASSGISSGEADPAFYSMRYHI
jgi:hypothetical protein